MSARVAYVCLLPDAGHAFPLIRQARAARAAGWQVKVFVPDTLTRVAKAQGLDTHGLGPVGDPDDRAIVRRHLSGGWVDRVRSRGAYVDTLVRENAHVADALHPLTDALTRWRPTILVTDDHRFGREYAALADRCGARWILNDSRGTTFDRDRVPHLEAMRVRLERRLGGALLRARRLRQRATRDPLPGSLARSDAVRTAFARAHEASPYAHTGYGTAPLEIRLGFPALEGRTAMGPLPPLDMGGLDEATQAWLDAAPAPVTYVCFGTMVEPAAAVRETLAATGARNLLLWASPSRPVGLPPTSRWVPWIDQPAALAHPAVQAFVTHGGASSIQEGLWFGKPLLVVPVAWDQHHNARFVDAAGVGVTVRPRGCPADAAFHTLRSDPAIAVRARALAEEIHAMDGAGAHSAMLERIEHSPRGLR